MDPHHDCLTKRRCARAGLLVRCRRCRSAYYWRKGLTWDEGEEWRRYVLDTHYHPERHTPIAVFEFSLTDLLEAERANDNVVGPVIL